MSGYREALEAAGAEVLVFKEFGSYQGDWWARIFYDGEPRWVHGSYGSCSGCDAFQAEFDCYDSEHCEEHRYGIGDEEQIKACAACQEALNQYGQRLSEFGRNYLDNFHTQEEAEREAMSGWDDGEEQLEFLRTNRIEV